MYRYGATKFDPCVEMCFRHARFEHLKVLDATNQKSIYLGGPFYGLNTFYVNNLTSEREGERGREKEECVTIVLKAAYKRINPKT